MQTESNRTGKRRFGGPIARVRRCFNLRLQRKYGGVFLVRGDRSRRTAEQDGVRVVAYATRDVLGAVAALWRELERSEI